MLWLLDEIHRILWNFKRQPFETHLYTLYLKQGRDEGHPLSSSGQWQQHLLSIHHFKYLKLWCISCSVARSVSLFFTDTSLSLLYIESVKTLFKETNFISQRQRPHKNDWWECDFEFGPHPSRTFNSLSCTQLQATEVSPDTRKGIHSSLEWKFHQNVLPGAWLTCTLLGYILLQ